LSELVKRVALTVHNENVPCCIRRNKNVRGERKAIGCVKKPPGDKCIKIKQRLIS
jgi:hypothetical protein